MIQEEKMTDSTEEKTIEKAERKYEYWLACVASVSRKKKRKLRTTYGSAKKIYNIIEERGEDFFPNSLIKDIKRLKQAKKGWDLDGKYEEARQREIWFVGEWERGFPARLAEIPDPPYALFVKGNLPDESCMSASIVGSRECTPYGELQTLKFAKTLAGCGVQIISGMAKGIDGHAHRGALQGNGKTFAVLGCGVDVCYPREHIGLYADILEHEGGILSEYPPGTTPERCTIPQRNRLISGLGDFLLVMEAKEKSGSLITVDLALEQGKDIYALPGPVSSPLSKGCNRLIHQGAEILLGQKESCENLEIQGEKEGQTREPEEKILDKTENMVYSRFGFDPKSLEELAEQMGLSVQVILPKLIALELKGKIREISTHRYVKV